MSGRLARIPPWVFWALLALGLGAVFVAMALSRVVDADEGIYLINARAVMNGEVPYLDFFYPQMFLLPYVYGLWLKLVGVSWYAGRVLSAIFAVTLGLLVARHVGQITGERAWGLLAALLLACSSLALAWYSVVKTYALATLLLFAAYAILFSGRRRWKYFLSGLLIGLAVDVRLYLAVVIPVLLIELIVRERAAPDFRMQLARFAVGLLVAFLPLEYFMLPDPGAFFFNIVGVHGVRSPAGFVGDLPQKFDLVLDMLGISKTYGVTSFQFAILCFVNATALIATVILHERLHLAATAALVLMAVSLVPTPAYAQYFCMALPFLVVNGVRFVAEVTAEPAGRRLQPILAVLLGAYVLAAPVDMYRYAVRNDLVPGVFISDDAKNWKIPAIRRVSQAIDAVAPPDHALAISWWPGYFVETRTALLPRLENPYGLWYSPNLALGDVLRYKFMSHPELLYHLHEHTAPVVVVGNMMFNTGPHYRGLLRENGYVMLQKLGDTEIYRWDSSGAPVSTAASPPAGPGR